MWAKITYYIRESLINKGFLWSCYSLLQKSAAPVLCDQRGGEQRHKRQSEYDNPRRQMRNFKHRHRNIGLDRGQQEQQDNGKAHPEKQVERVAQNLPIISS